MGKLYFKYGVMGSSKTANALMKKYNYEENGFKVWLIKPDIDIRTMDTVVSRVGLMQPCSIISPKIDIAKEYEKVKSDVIIADESQFFTENQIDQLRFIADNSGAKIICYGLKTDFQTHLFSGSKRLLEISDKIEEVKTICSCGKKAIISARVNSDGEVIKDGEKILLGWNDLYKPKCHKCFMKKTKTEQLTSEKSKK